VRQVNPFDWGGFRTIAAGRFDAVLAIRPTLTSKQFRAPMLVHVSTYASANNRNLFACFIEVSVYSLPIALSFLNDRPRCLLTESTEDRRMIIVGSGFMAWCGCPAGVWCIGGG
jgi:hypothetical protein